MNSGTLLLLLIVGGGVYLFANKKVSITPVTNTSSSLANPTSEQVQMVQATAKKFQDAGDTAGYNAFIQQILAQGWHR